jgi:hypothetical protein
VKHSISDGLKQVVYASTDGTDGENKDLACDPIISHKISTYIDHSIK